MTTRTSAALLILTALPGCFDLGDFKFNFFACAGTSGDQGRYSFYFQEGFIFPSCPGPDQVALPPDGARARLTATANDKTIPPWTYAQSSDPGVVEVDTLLRLKSHAAGSASIQLLDGQRQVIDSIAVRVVNPESLEVANTTPDLRVVAGALVTTTLTPARTGTSFVGVGAGYATAAPPLSVTSPPSASDDPPGLFDDANTAPTTVEVSADATGASVLSLSVGPTARANLFFQIIDADAVDEAHAEPASLFIAGSGGQAAVRIVGSSGGAPVRGLDCRWSVPAGLSAPAASGVEDLGAAPGSGYFVTAVAAGSFTARCSIGDALFVDVPVTVAQ